MSEYLVLMRAGDIDFAQLGAAEGEALMSRFIAWSQRLQAEGHFRSVERLSANGGKTLRSHGGSVVIDGPYAEGRELVVGLFVIAARDWGEAERAVRDCPILALGGTVELRETEPFPSP
jgi:hypothetical protein